MEGFFLTLYFFVAVSVQRATLINDDNAVDTCRDKYADCSVYGPRELICHGAGPDATFARQQCPRYCGYCTPGAIFLTSAMPSIITSSGTIRPGCHYKNQLYQHGETWQDSCQYRCICIDGNTHQYSCASVCLNWQLPSVCHLDPPARGKCCHTPNCPANVIINYPSGYIPE